MHIDATVGALAKFSSEGAQGSGELHLRVDTLMRAGFSQRASLSRQLAQEIRSESSQLLRC